MSILKDKTEGTWKSGKGSWLEGAQSDFHICKQVEPTPNKILLLPEKVFSSVRGEVRTPRLTVWSIWHLDLGFCDHISIEKIPKWAINASTCLLPEMKVRQPYCKKRFLIWDGGAFL
jgi:hypothetical protein